MNSKLIGALVVVLALYISSASGNVVVVTQPSAPSSANVTGVDGGVVVTGTLAAGTVVVAPGGTVSSPSYAGPFSFQTVTKTQFNHAGKVYGPMASDGTNFWSYTTNGSPGCIRRFDSSATELSSLCPPWAGGSVNTMMRMTFDGTYFWFPTAASYASVVKLDTSGNILTTYSFPSQDPAAVISDGTYIWMVSNNGTGSFGNNCVDFIKVSDGAKTRTTYAGTYAYLRAITTDGTYLYAVGDHQMAKFQISDRSFVGTYAVGSGQLYDITFDGTNLWVAGGAADKLYKVSTAGAVLGTYSVATTQPWNVAWDGTNVWVLNRNDFSSSAQVFSTSGVSLALYSVGGGPATGLYYDAVRHVMWAGATEYLTKFSVPTVSYPSIGVAGAMQAPSFSLVTGGAQLSGGVNMFSMLTSLSGTTMAATSVPDGGTGLTVTVDNPNAAALGVTGKVSVTGAISTTVGILTPDGGLPISGTCSAVVVDKGTIVGCTP